MNVGSAVEEGYAILHEVSELISDGLEGKLISILDRQLSVSFPQHMVCCGVIVKYEVLFCAF